MASDFITADGRHFPSSNTLKYIPTSVISFVMESLRKLLLFLLWILSIFFTLSGISIPYLWDVFLILALSFERMVSCFHNVYGTHYPKDGLSDILRNLENYAVLTGCDSFMSFKATQYSELYPQFTNREHPTVVFLSLFQHR